MLMISLFKWNRSAPRPELQLGLEANSVVETA
jgi:hypothetical protein